MFFDIFGHQTGGNGPGRHLKSFLEAVAPSWLNMGPRRANENSVPGLMQPLVTAAIDVNVQISPRTRKWRALLATARWAANRGTKRQLLLEMATWAGATPLMGAVKQGKVAETQELLALRADPTLRNRQGLTALDLVKSKFGVVPPLLQQLLDT